MATQRVFFIGVTEDNGATWALEGEESGWSPREAGFFTELGEAVADCERRNAECREEGCNSEFYVVVPSDRTEAVEATRTNVI